MADCHAQLKPIYYREPSVNLGVGDADGLPPHLTDRALLERFGVEAGSRDAYALSSEDFEASRAPTAASAAWIAWRRS